MTFLTYRELGQRWRLGRKSIERLVSRGEIQPTRIGRNVRFAIAEIEQYEKRQSGDADPADAAQERLDAALAAAGDKLAGMAPEPAPASWSRGQASKYRDLLLGLESLSEAGVDRLVKLAHEHGVDSDRLELHVIAVRMHSEAQPIAGELAARQSALNAMTESYSLLGGGVHEPTLLEQTEARNRVTESHNAARIVTYVSAVFPELFGVKPTTILEPRTGLLTPLLNRARELGLADELLDSLRGETATGAADVDDGTPPQPWWQNRKLPDRGEHPEPSQERAMTL